MEINTEVQVIDTKRTGTIVDIQKSLNGRDIYLIQFNEYEIGSYFKDEIRPLNFYNRKD